MTRVKVDSDFFIYFCHTMKRLLTTLYLLVFLIGAVGINIQAHYCGGMLSMVSVNGLPVHANDMEGMAGCGEGDGCPHCKNIHSHFQVNNQFWHSPVVLQQPSPSLPDWFHGDLPVLGLPFRLTPTEVVASVDDRPVCRPARCHPGATLPPGGWRAPPVV